MGSAAGGVDGAVQDVPERVPALFPRVPRRHHRRGLLEQLVVSIARAGTKGDGAAVDEDNDRVLGGLDDRSEEGQLRARRVQVVAVEVLAHRRYLSATTWLPSREECNPDGSDTVAPYLAEVRRGVLRGGERAAVADDEQRHVGFRGDGRRLLHARLVRHIAGHAVRPDRLRLRRVRHLLAPAAFARLPAGAARRAAEASAALVLHGEGVARRVGGLRLLPQAPARLTAGKRGRACCELFGLTTAWRTVTVPGSPGSWP